MEFVTAGWVMEDEANSVLYAMVDQIIEGNRYVYDKFGLIPKAAWSIDPFGQSSTSAYLRKRMGFQNMVIQRTHFQVKNYFLSSQNLEFFWRQNWDADHSNDIFCHMLTYSSYCSPDQCGPDKSVCMQFDYSHASAKVNSITRYSP